LSATRRVWLTPAQACLAGPALLDELVLMPNCTSTNQKALHNPQFTLVRVARSQSLEMDVALNCVLNGVRVPYDSQGQSYWVPRSVNQAPVPHADARHTQGYFMPWLVSMQRLPRAVVHPYQPSTQAL